MNGATIMGSVECNKKKKTFQKMHKSLKNVMLENGQ